MHKHTHFKMPTRTHYKHGPSDVIWLHPGPIMTSHAEITAQQLLCSSHAVWLEHLQTLHHIAPDGRAVGGRVERGRRRPGRSGEG